jgi:hypothetical protein
MFGPFFVQGQTGQLALDFRAEVLYDHRHPIDSSALFQRRQFAAGGVARCAGRGLRAGEVGTVCGSVA